MVLSGKKTPLITHTCNYYPLYTLGSLYTYNLKRTHRCQSKPFRNG